MLVSSTGD
jgi:hypothetical protein